MSSKQTSTSSAPAPSPPKKAEEKQKSWWDKYGFIIACIGFGLAFLFFLIIIYLLWTRPSSQVAPSQSNQADDDDYNYNYMKAPVSQSKDQNAYNADELGQQPQQQQQQPNAMDYDLDTTPMKSPLKQQPPMKPPQGEARVDGGKYKKNKGRSGKLNGRRAQKGGCGCSGIAATPQPF